MNANKLEPIRCELRRKGDFYHLVELKTGKEKLVSFGRLFPLKTTKRYVRDLQQELGIEVTNLHQFFKEIRAAIKEQKGERTVSTTEKQKY